MAKRYRVIIWGPGHVGGAAMKECLRRPEFEVVGARVWSPEKNGVDVGELVGRGPIGVRATTDTDELVALHADCVIHTPLPPLDETEMTADVIRLLESGKNVISAQSYFNPRTREADVADRLEEACRVGNSTLLGAGLHPSFILERLTMTLTGLFNEIQHIRLVEQVDCAKMLAENPFAREYVGWGVDAKVVDEERMHAQIAIRLYRDSIYFAAERLFGAKPSEVRVDITTRGIPAEKTLACGPVVIEPGQAKTIVYEMKGYVRDHHFYTGEEYWFLGPENRTISGFEGACSYLVEISGNPAGVRMRLDIESNAKDDASITSYITAAPMVQAIVPVCAAEPGFMTMEPLAYCATDLRRLVVRHNVPQATDFAGLLASWARGNGGLSMPTASEG